VRGGIDLIPMNGTFAVKLSVMVRRSKLELCSSLSMGLPHLIGEEGDKFRVYLDGSLEVYVWRIVTRRFSAEVY
jgi:hypothetical protein